MQTGQGVFNMVELRRRKPYRTGVLVAMVRVSGWNEVKQLPKVIRLEERVLVRTGWNSDSMVAYYRSDRMVAHPFTCECPVCWK